MEVLEIRRGLRRMDFTAKDEVTTPGQTTHVLVEFEVSARLAADQLVLINLGLHDGVRRELQGRPRLIKPSAADAGASSFMYRLEGDVA